MITIDAMYTSLSNKLFPFHYLLVKRWMFGWETVQKCLVTLKIRSDRLLNLYLSKIQSS